MKPITPDIRQEIQALIAEHAWLLDHGASDKLYNLYSVNGELLNLPPRDLVGRDAIEEWGRERVKLPRVSRHVETNHRLYWDGEVLRGTLYASVYRSEEAPAIETAPFMVGDYEDEYVLEDGKWLIRRRVIRKAFRVAK
ncbi:nuclear transport factor 2 family protein [Paraburkholderia sp. BCC1884]|uniref:nuclear transport factor 2 family protein n=1 Tax=Paraburkholderia sp. BCC1884 TaxID=2562668 RepID=UPI001184056E|nr:nuclear transport factor 2 family protein [Paraburkholderia sp. BCC1884]